MQVILMERIGRLGQMGDVVNVKNGYARNFLLPKGKALRASKQNMTQFESQRVHLEARNLVQKTEASGIAEKLEGKSFVAIRQAGDTGQLYGSVSTRDIAVLITEGGFAIERGQVLIQKPIKMLGLQEMRISLHPEVSVPVIINVARTEEEADRQSRGEDITLMQDDLPEFETYDPNADDRDDREDDEPDTADAGAEDATAGDGEQKDADS